MRETRQIDMYKKGILKGQERGVRSGDLRGTRPSILVDF